MPKSEQITDARLPLSTIQTVQGEKTWAAWLREQKGILDHGDYYQPGSVFVTTHGNSTIALWGTPRKAI